MSETHEIEITAAVAWARVHESAALDELRALLRFPTVSADPARAEDMQRCAYWLAEQARQIGLHKCAVHQTNGAPVVCAEWLGAGEDSLTVLIYAHYDVVPADTWDAWHTSPFEPDTRTNRLYARGALDDKCSVWAMLATLEAMLTTADRLPINVKVLLDGDAERGSPDMVNFAVEHLHELHADLLVFADDNDLNGQPLILTGTRGLVEAEVMVRGPKQDVDAGALGGLISNPIHIASRIIAALHDDEGRIRIPDFYRRVRMPSLVEKFLTAQTEPMVQQRAVEEAGADAILHGAKGSLAQRAVLLPACDINGVWGGHQGYGGKQVIPAETGFKVSLHIVPNQYPQEALRQLIDFVKSFEGNGATIEVTPVSAHWHADLLSQGPVIDALQTAYEIVWGTHARLYRAGRCLPFIGIIQQLLGLPSVEFGFGAGGNRHAPDEYIDLGSFRRGVETAIHFFHRLAAIHRESISPWRYRDK